MDPDPWEAICDFNDHPLWITYSRNLPSGAIALDPRKSFAYQLLYEKPLIQLRFDKKNVHLYNFSYTTLSRESGSNHISTKEYNMATTIHASPASTTSWSFETIFKFDFSEISARISSIASRCFECLKSLWDRAATAVSSFFTKAPASPVPSAEDPSAGGATGIQGAVNSVRAHLGSEEPKAQELAVAGSHVEEGHAITKSDEV